MTTTLHISTIRHDEWQGKPRYIRIYVHDTTAELQAAAGKYKPEHNWAGVGACYHPPPTRNKYDEKTKKWVNTTRPSWGGVIRISREYLDSEVVSHECVHAACAIYRMDVHSKIHLSDECNYREEALAYIVGDLYSSLNIALEDAGLW